ncbi:hypothetical protein ABK040_008522 [Willaertia magna]
MFKRFDVKYMHRGEWKIGKLIKKEITNNESNNNNCNNVIIEYNEKEFMVFSEFVKEILQTNETIKLSELQLIKFFYNNQNFISYMELSSMDANFVKKRGNKLRYVYEYLLRENEVLRKEEYEVEEIIERINKLSIENKLKISNEIKLK